MTAAALLLAAALAQDPGVGDALRGDAMRATFRCEPERVEVGEPFELVLELSHATDASVFDLGRDDLELDPSWVVLGRRREAPVPDPQAPGRSLTRRTWTVVSLEAGERPLADRCSGLVADARVRTVDAGAAVVSVASVLGPDEDAPRPLRGFPPGFGAQPETGVARHLIAVGVGAALLWAALLALLVRRWRAKRRTGPVPGPAPLERLAALEAEADSDPGALRARHFRLTDLVREATERAVGEAQPGLTDEEWLVGLRARPDVSQELVGDLAEVFERSEGVKYANLSPSTWATEETLRCARRAVERAREAEVSA